MTRTPATRKVSTTHACSRRDCLKTMGAAVLGAAASRATGRIAGAEDLRAKAKTKINLGILQRVRAFPSRRPSAGSGPMASPAS